MPAPKNATPPPKVEIFSPLEVFVREHRQKPFHQQLVTLNLFGCLCHNGCGLYYVAPDPADNTKPLLSDQCPTCMAHPKLEKLSTELEQVEFSVKCAFGNLISADFVRAVGPLKITRVPLVFSTSATAPSDSRGVVVPPKR